MKQRDWSWAMLAGALALILGMWWATADGDDGCDPRYDDCRDEGLAEAQGGGW